VASCDSTCCSDASIGDAKCQTTATSTFVLGDSRYALVMSPLLGKSSGRATTVVV
jgi:hypothetical protein